MFKKLTLFTLSIGLFVQVNAQDDLLSMFDEETTNYATAAFKATRVVLGQSIENPKNGNLNLIIQHQFGLINDGAYEMFGLDQATIRLGFEYGVNDWLGIGLGRSSFNKTFDGYTKVKLLRQSSGKKNIPISLSYFGGVYVNSLRWDDPSRENYPVNRLSYAHQLLIARKFNESLTFQLSPTLIHRNLVELEENEHDVLAIAPAGRIKISKWVSLNMEYFYVLPGNTADNFEDAFSIGLDIETGGHVFNVYVTNSQGMQEPYFVAQTTGVWGDGDIRFCFNLNRTFVLKKPKSFRKE